MTAAKDIFCAAQRMLAEQGDGAVRHAAMLMSELEYHGDDNAAERWRDIPAAITRLRETAIVASVLAAHSGLSTR
jgi:hypothetical protein